MNFFRDKTSDLAIHNPHYRQQSRVCKGGIDITTLKESEAEFMSYLQKKHQIFKLAGVTDALQQRSRYQCALKKSEECISCF